MESRSVRINIPETVEEYIMAKTSDDIEECLSVKQRFEAVYKSSTDSLKESIRSFVDKFLGKNKINQKKELDGLFDILY